MEKTALGQHTLAQRLCVRRCVNSIQKAQKESDMQLKSSSTHLDTLSVPCCDRRAYIAMGMTNASNSRQSSGEFRHSAHSCQVC